MGGSGLEILWETVYPSGSVIHMMTGDAYSRAVRAHLLTSAALHVMLLSAHEQLNEMMKIEEKDCVRCMHFLLI